jgi:hypothetical protein
MAKDMCQKIIVKEYEKNKNRSQIVARELRLKNYY